MRTPRWGSRRRPTLPLALTSSTIGAGGLNCRVRNGYGCDPSAIAAENRAPRVPPPTEAERVEAGSTIEATKSDDARAPDRAKMIKPHG